LGQREYTATRKRLGELVVAGYVAENWRNSRKVYFLTQKGLLLIESHIKRPYNPKGYTTDHALYAVELAAFIHLRTGIANDSFVFDREMEFNEKLKPLRAFSGIKKDSKDKVHAPDFILGNRCYEIELNTKTKARLRENFLINSKYFDRQVWLVPSRLKTLQNNLKALAEEYKCPVQIITTEELEKQLKIIDISKNEYGRNVELSLKQEPEQRKNILEDLD
jgi:hypothetical protein